MKIVIADANLVPLRAHLEGGFPSGSEVSWADPRDLETAVVGRRRAGR